MTTSTELSHKLLPFALLFEKMLLYMQALEDDNASLRDLIFWYQMNDDEDN
jgi:hypothetical protein